MKYILRLISDDSLHILREQVKITSLKNRKGKSLIFVSFNTNLIRNSTVKVCTNQKLNHNYVSNILLHYFYVFVAV